ncbi:MAG: hypothetical protein ABI557_17810, partial [Aureliella sp.]
FQFSYRRNDTRWDIMARRLNGPADKQAEINDSIDLVEDGQRHAVVLEFRYAKQVATGCRFQRS